MKAFFFKQRSHRYYQIIPLYFLYIGFATTSIHQPEHAPNISHGTIIIGYVKDNTVWVAADSRTTTRNRLTGKAYLSDTTCKIITGKNIVVAKAALGGDSARIFDVNTIIHCCPVKC